MDDNELCRFCLVTDSLHPIFSNDSLICKILSCLSIVVDINDGLPEFICEKCLEDINKYDKFRKRCKATESELKQLYQFEYIVEDENELIKDNMNMTTFQYSAQENGKQNDTNSKIDNNSKIICKKVIVCEKKLKILIQKHIEKQVVKHIWSLGYLQPPEKTLEDPLDSMVQSDAHNITLDIPETAEQSTILENISVLCENNSTNDTSEEEEPILPELFKCDTCGKVFGKRELLRVHKFVHRVTRPVKCKLCPSTFKHQRYLWSHMRSHSQERPHKCHLCPRVFTGSSALAVHIRVHLGIKNYLCQTCGKSFVSHNKLSLHTVTHTGVKAFCCDLCQKKFARKAHLVRHQKVHQ